MGRTRVKVDIPPTPASLPAPPATVPPVTNAAVHPPPVTNAALADAAMNTVAQDRRRAYDLSQAAALAAVDRPHEPSTIDPAALRAAFATLGVGENEFWQYIRDIQDARDLAAAAGNEEAAVREVRAATERK